MSTFIFIAQIHVEKSSNSFQKVSFYRRSNKEIIRLSRWADGFTSSGGATAGAGPPFDLLSPFPISGLFPSTAEKSFFSRIQPGWRQVWVECVNCGARALLDRSYAAQLWQQTSELLNTIHKEGCEYAKSFSSSASSIVSEQGKTHNIHLFLSENNVHF